MLRRLFNHLQTTLLLYALIVTCAVTAVPACAQVPPMPYNKGGGQTLTINGLKVSRDMVFRFLPVTLPLAKIRVTSLYGLRMNPFGGYGVEMHPGVDFAAPIGTPVFSTAAGVVTFAGISGEYGAMVEVSHGLGFKTRYAHLSEIDVAPGEIVDRNHIVGLVGSSGRSTGPHLYLEIWHYGIRIDPVRFILEANALYYRLR
jgi:murein DD-endopeptidase MepM/ murein hydrolase activator NlpD